MLLAGITELDLDAIEIDLQDPCWSIRFQPSQRIFISTWRADDHPYSYVCVTWEELVSDIKGLSWDCGNWLAALYEGALHAHLPTDDYEQIKSDWLTYTALDMLQYGRADVLIICDFEHKGF